MEGVCVMGLCDVEEARLVHLKRLVSGLWSVSQAQELFAWKLLRDRGVP